MNARFRFYAVAMISLLAAGQALADESRDFSGLSADSSALQGRQQELLSQQNEYLKGSKKLRSQSDEDMARLINEICGTDIKRSENYGLDIAMRMADDVRARISDIYEPLKAEKDKMDKKIDDQKKDLEEIQSKYAYLANSSEYGDKAKPILEEIKREIEETKTVKDSVMRDFNSLTNVSDGIMKGANNPQVRAAMDYGKDQHEKKQGDLGCDDKEVEVSGGRRADCVKFTESDGCVVIEIKPDTYSESKAIDQAKSYIDGLKSKYKDNDKAKKYCKQDSDGNWIFKADWKTYPACKPGRL